MDNFEEDYIKIIRNIMEYGDERKGRNGITKSLFGTQLSIDMSDNMYFPLLMGRKIFYKGIFGEMAAFLKGPSNIIDFEDEGCNYWKQWADGNGDLALDYGNLWRDFNGVDQMRNLVDTLKTNPTDRRMIISGWNPGHLRSLSLPCCHIMYQWYVREGQYLDMMWYQRSVDTMVGMPSDIVLAAIWNILLANECSYRPGKITMVFGDTHIYSEHFDKIEQYIKGWYNSLEYHPTYALNEESTVDNFKADDIIINDYQPATTIKFEVKA